MRVAFVLGTTSGGTGRHVRMLVEGLVRRGHQVLVVGPASVEAAFSFTEAGARFADVPVSDRPHPVNDLRAITAIRRLTHEADVVHAHGLRAGASTALARLGARRAGKSGEQAESGAQGDGAVRPPAGSGSVGGGGSGASAESGAQDNGVVKSPAGSGSAGDEGSGAPAPGGAVRGEGAGVPVGRGRAALVVTLHNALTASGVIGAVYAVLERIVARGADRILVVSPDLGERMRKLGARSVSAAVVPAPALRPATRTPEQVRDELGAGERPILLALVRLAQQKGLDMLLDVAAGPWTGRKDQEDSPPSRATDGPVEGSSSSTESAAGDRHDEGSPEVEPWGSARGEWREERSPGAEAYGVPRGGARGDGSTGAEVHGGPLFVVAGGGPLMGELQARIDREQLPVVLLGNRDDVPDLLATATAVLWASRWEGQPLSLSETLKAGKPVIATAVGGIPDLLGGAGVLVPFGDVAGMRAAVQKVVTDPDAADALARASAKRGAELPSDDDAVEAVLEAYRPG